VDGREAGARPPAGTPGPGDMRHARQGRAALLVPRPRFGCGDLGCNASRRGSNSSSSSSSSGSSSSGAAGAAGAPPQRHRRC
jgi:hypothetical protein